jgi:hypothetical protein
MPHDATELHPKGMLGRLRMNLRTALVSTGVGFALAFAGIAFAQAPAGSTGECKDGSYTTNATKRGAFDIDGGLERLEEFRDAHDGSRRRRRGQSMGQLVVERVPLHE